MSSTSQPVQEQRLANLTVLHQSLKELAASTKSSVATTAKERPVVLQGPVLVARGK